MAGGVADDALWTRGDGGRGVLRRARHRRRMRVPKPLPSPPNKNDAQRHHQRAPRTNDPRLLEISSCQSGSSSSSMVGLFLQCFIIVFSHVFLSMRRRRRFPSSVFCSFCVIILRLSRSEKEKAGRRNNSRGQSRGGAPTTCFASSARRRRRRRSTLLGTASCSGESSPATTRKSPLRTTSTTPYRYYN